MRPIDADKELKNISEMVVKGETFTTAVEFAKIILRNAPTVNSWKEVYDELIKNEMLCGKYDARTSVAEHFINGVWTVMEYIAERAGCHDEFDEMFVQNLKESEDRAERRMLEKAEECKQ